MVASSLTLSKYSRNCLIRHLKGIRKKWQFMQTGKNSIIEARILYHCNSYTYIVLLFAVKYKFVTLRLNTTIKSWTPPFNLAPFKYLTNCKDFPCSLNVESGRSSHLVYQFDKQNARCDNYQLKTDLICLNSHTY